MSYQYKKDAVLVKFKPANKCFAMGWFDEDTGLIYIDEHFSDIEREVIYFHERQHRKCKEEGCFCTRSISQFWPEYHAMRAEFEASVAAGPEYVRAYKRLFAEALKRYKADLRAYRGHYTACQKLMRLKKFREIMF